MGTKTRFEEEAKGNSEMAYFIMLFANAVFNVFTAVFNVTNCV